MKRPDVAAVALIVAGCALAQNQVSSGTPATSPDGAAPISTATLTVENGERLVGPEWHLNIAWAGERPFKVGHQPELCYFVRNQAGEWEDLRVSFAGSAFSLYPMHSPASGTWHWVVDPGESIDFTGEVADWRVLGFPGTYKAKLTLPGIGDVWSDAFSIASSGDAGNDPTAPIVGDTEQSDAFKEVMRYRLIPSCGLPEADRRLRAQILRELAGRFSGDTTPRMSFHALARQRDKLSQAADLPTALRDRIELSRLLEVGRGLTFQPSEDLAVVAQAAEWASRIAAMGSKSGHVGRVARYQWLVYAKEAGLPGCEGQLAAARLDPMMRGIAASYLEGSERLAIFADVVLVQQWSGLSSPRTKVPEGHSTETTGPTAPVRQLR